MNETDTGRLVAIAKAEIGYTESPPGSNRNKYAAEVAPVTQGQSWCAVFVSWCYQRAGMPLPAIQPQAVPAGGFAYCPYAVTYARHHGETVPFEQAQPGDVALFDWPPRDGVADHVGIVTGTPHGVYVATVEGNTSSSSAGDQSNGGGVFARVRNRADIQAVWRPTVGHAPGEDSSSPVHDYREDTVQTKLIRVSPAGFTLQSDPWDPGFGRPPLPVGLIPNGLVPLDIALGVEQHGTAIVVMGYPSLQDGTVQQNPFDVWLSVA